MKKNREKTPKQNRTLNWLLTEAGYDPNSEEARDVLEAACGKRKRREMDFYEYQEAIKYLTEKMGRKPGGSNYAPQPEPAPKKPGKPTDYISPEQTAYINGLYDQIGATPEQRIEINRRTIKGPWPQNIGEGQKIIQMLLDMTGRGYMVNQEKGDG